MQAKIALGTLLLAFNANAAPPWIVPHLEKSGVVTWTATIDAATVGNFKVGDDGRGNQARQALNEWLDQHISQLSWCKYGWRYRTEEPEKYIEDLGNEGLRVLGVCETPGRSNGVVR